MAWIQSHQEVEDHPKTLALMALLGWDLDKAIAKVHRFWWWCLRYALDGDLRRYNDSQLAIAVGLDPSLGKQFVQAMVSCGGETASGFIDREPYFRVHDWWDTAGPFIISKYKKDTNTWQIIRNSYKGSSTNSTHTEITDIDNKKNTVPYVAFLDLWQQNCGTLPKARGLSTSRREHIKARWEEKQDLAYWQGVIERLARGKFAQGHNERGWKATFDFLISNDENHLKVMEGKYDDRRSSWGSERLPKLPTIKPGADPWATPESESVSAEDIAKAKEPSK